jgi:putative ABC transport system ATP-binding protein
VSATAFQRDGSGGLEVRDASVRYGGLVAVAPLSLTVAPGQMLAVTGPSGAGKTSLLWLMAGALEPDSGSVHVAGSPLGGRPDAAARGVSVVPQGNGLAAVLTAFENIVVPLLEGGVAPDDADARARESLEVVGLEEWAGHLVEELSGGQQQRVAVARALATTASVLLADEPTSDLDGRNREVVLTALRAAADRGAVVVLATHDPEAAAAADGELALDTGEATWVRPLPTR